MLKWALIFFIVSIVAGVFGFGGISAGAADIAKILFYIFVVDLRDLPDPRRDGRQSRDLTPVRACPRPERGAARRPFFVQGPQFEGFERRGDRLTTLRSRSAGRSSRSGSSGSSSSEPVVLPQRQAPGRGWRRRRSPPKPQGPPPRRPAGTGPGVPSAWRPSSLGSSPIRIALHGSSEASLSTSPRAARLRRRSVE